MFHVSVKTLAHLEPLLHAEMEELGVCELRTGRRVVHGVADKGLVYAMNYRLRTALRVLVEVIRFRSRNPDYFYKRCSEIEWENIIGGDQTFAIDPNVRSGQYRHPHFAALRLKDAIADRFVRLTGARPDVDPDDPDVRIHLHIQDDQVHVLLDSSGRSLNQRGYRVSGGSAPVNEVLAAGLVLQTGWKGETMIVDPMCGSGTIAIEAAMIALHIPPQHLRPDFGCTRWRDFDPALWDQVRTQADGCRLPLRNVVLAADADRRQVECAARNIREAGLEGAIEVRHADFSELEPPAERAVLLMNPPYGERIDPGDLLPLYRRIGQVFKHRWPGCRAWVLSGNAAALNEIGLRPFARFPFVNGTLECRLAGYELYAGSRKSVLAETSTPRQESEGD